MCWEAGRKEHCVQEQQEQGSVFCYHSTFQRVFLHTPRLGQGWGAWWVRKQACGGQGKRNCHMSGAHSVPGTMLSTSVHSTLAPL